MSDKFQLVDEQRYYLITYQSEEIDHNKIPTNVWVVSKNFFHRRQAFFPVLHLNGLFPH